MSSIQTGIELNDGFSGVMEHIIRAVDAAVGQMELMQQAMNQPVNTRSMEAVRSQVIQAASAYNELADSMRSAAEIDVSTNSRLMNNGSSLEVVRQNAEQQPVINTSEAITIPVTPEITEQPVVDVPEEIVIPVTARITEQESVQYEDVTVPVTPVVADAPDLNIPRNATVAVQPVVESEPAEQRIAEIQQQLQGIIPMQEAINAVARNSYVLPEGTAQEVDSVNQEIRRMQAALDYLRETPFEMDSSFAALQMGSLQEAIDGVIERQQKLDALMGNMPSQTVNVDVEPIVPDPLVENPETVPLEVQPHAPPEPVEVPFEWVADDFDVFVTSGVERYRQELASLTSVMDTVSSLQDQITQRANESEILSPEASYYVQNLENRLYDLRNMIQQVEENSLSIGTDEANAQLERLRIQMMQVQAYQENLEQAMQGTDISTINTAYMNLSRTISSTEQSVRSVRDSFQEPVEIPVVWQTDNTPPVFDSSGVERFQQELSSTEQMLNRLNEMQMNLASGTSNADFLPPQAMQDINSLSGRITVLQEQIRQIENNPLNIGSDTANAGLEQLRGQLSSILQLHEQLNTAIDGMDVSGANAAYLRLSQTINNTERYIRDNTDEQGQFNQAIEEGISQADNLMDMIKGAASAYIGIQSVSKALNISDELTQTTSRLDMMNDGLQSTSELVNMVYAAAQDARGLFAQMADVVARFGNNAGSAFDSSEQVVAFANLIQKQMTIAGASTQEASNAMLQLSQALGSGVLRGDELNSIFEQSPNLIQSIAKYISENDSLVQQMASKLKISEEELTANTMGHIRDIASEGMISADIVKAAIFASADDINSKFESMPMTWGQIWQSMQNTALIAFQPVLQRLNDIGNSDTFQTFVSGAIEAMAMLANIVLNIFELVGSVGGFIADNWSIISPIIYGVIAALAVYAAYLAIVKGIELASAAATAVMTGAKLIGATAMTLFTGATWGAAAAQLGLNGALYACPLVWIIVLIIAVIAAVFALANAIAKMTGIANSGFGVITGNIAMVMAFFKNLGLTVANISQGIYLASVALGHNMMAAFRNAISSIQAWFYDLLSTAMTVIEGICEALNKLPFVEFDFSGITGAADQYAAKAAKAAGNKESYQSISGAFSEGMSTFDTFQDGWASKAFSAGAAWGDGIADKVSNFSISDLVGKVDIPNVDDYTSGFADAMNGSGAVGNLDDIAGNTGSIKDSLDCTEEDLKYLRDIAEQEAINRFTTAEIKIEQTNHNNISSKTDLDGIVSYLTDGMVEAIEISTEGVHA